MNARPEQKGVAVAPRVSVLLPVYEEAPERLGRAAASILAQDYADWELLLVDDGSERPDTRAAIAGLEAADARVRVLRCGRQGLVGALNAGLAAARGEFVARQDSDDWSEPSRLGEQVRMLAAHPAISVAGTQAVLHRADGRRLWQTRLAESPDAIAEAFRRGANPFVHGATCFRRERALAAGGYREAFGGAEDFDFFWRLSAEGQGANLSQALYHYRYTPISVSSRGAARQIVAHEGVRHWHALRTAGTPVSPAQAMALAERTAVENAGREGRLRLADRTLLAGEGWAAASAYAAELARQPANPRAWAKALRAAVFVACPAAGATLWNWRAGKAAL